MVRVAIEYSVQTAVQASGNVCRVAGMFGLGIDDSRRMMVLPRVEVDCRPGEIVFVTGASGSGKTTLLRCLKKKLTQQPGVAVIDFHELDMTGDRAIVDCLGKRPLKEILQLLSVVGLSDAFTLLRNFNQLSEGQQYRFRLAKCLVKCLDMGNEKHAVILADEFAATLDRRTARVVAGNIRKWVKKIRKQMKVTFVASTTHEDLLEVLQPEVLVEQRMGGGIEVVSSVLC